MEKQNRAAVAKHTAAAGAFAAFKKTEGQAKAVLALGKVDENLSGDELTKLLVEDAKGFLETQGQGRAPGEVKGGGRPARPGRA